MRSTIALIATLAFAGAARAEPGGPFVNSSSYALLPTPYAETLDPLVVTPGSEVRLDVTADEPLSSATLHITGPETLSTSGIILGNQAFFALQINRKLLAGTYSASVVLSDGGGQSRTTTIALPPPGFVVTDFVDSPCLLTDGAGVAVCTDTDGDGRPGRSSACPTQVSDCDDTNPTIGNGFLEVPGDNADNDCLGDGDLPVNEDIGVFVAPPPAGGGIDPNGNILPVRSGAWYDWSSSCNLFQDDDGSLYFWDASGSRNGAQCGAYDGDVVDPSRDTTSMGSCWAPIWARSPTGANILTPIPALAPGGAQSEVEFSSNNCRLDNLNSCIVRWKPNNAIVTGNLGTSGSGWYQGQATVNVRKPPWGSECPLPGSPSNFTWSPPGIGTEDPSCTQCDGNRVVWTMNRTPAVLDERWQYVDNPHAHPTVMIIHQGNFKSRTDIAPANQPDAQSTIASEHWPMYTLAVLDGNLHVTNNTELAIGVGTRKNRFPSTIVDGNFQIPSNGALSLAGVNLVRGNVVGPVPPTVFGGFVVGSDIEDGTRSGPYHTLRSGIEAARPLGKYVFVALGDYDDDGAPLLIDVPLIGGFIDTGWTRAPLNQSRVTFTSPATISAQLVMGFDMLLAGSMTIDLASLVDSTILDGSGSDVVSMTSNVRLFRCSVEPAIVVTGSSTLLASRSEIGSLTMAPTAISVIQRTIVSGAMSTSNGTFKATRSYVVGPITAENSALTLSNSTLRPAAGAAAASVSGAGSVILVDTIVEGTSVALAVTNRTITRVFGSLLDVGCPVTVNGVCQTTPCTVNGNICNTASFAAADDFHIAADSLAVDAAVFVRGSVPTTSVVDLDGECVLGRQDIGADEVR